MVCHVPSNCSDYLILTINVVNLHTEAIDIQQKETPRIPLERINLMQSIKKVFFPSIFKFNKLLNVRSYETDSKVLFKLVYYRNLPTFSLNSVLQIRSQLLLSSAPYVFFVSLENRQSQAFDRSESD